MTLYVRGYRDFSYELIFLEGRFRKNRLHILVNPSKRVHLPGSQQEGIELNIESLTHILTMEASVRNHDLIDRTTFIAERTNKPIITNNETAEQFKERGLSVRQLRVLGFEQEVVDGIQIDPVYMEELSDEVKPPQKKKPLEPLIDVVKKVNPLNWKPVKRLTRTILPAKFEEEEQIDPSKPLAFHIELGGSESLLLPLDKRGVLHLDKIIPTLETRTLIVPNQDLSFIKDLPKGLSKVIILNEDVGEEPIIIPRSHNNLPHNSLYGSLEVWIEIE